MAYNNGFQMPYPYYQPMQMMPPQPVQNIQQPVAQGGFVRVRDENEARMYPVAPGQSVTFVNENSPYCYTKTVNMGQLDRPIFEKYRLVKEEENPMPDASQKPDVPGVDLSVYALSSDLDAIRLELESIKSDLYGIAGKKKAKKEAVTDE